MRGRLASRTASQARSMSALLQRASPAMAGAFSICPTSRATRRTASKSPGEAMGKPASMISTPSRANWRAISSFSSMFSVAPGDCSPSRSVVSKIRTTSEPSM